MIVFKGLCLRGTQCLHVTRQRAHVTLTIMIFVSVAIDQVVVMPYLQTNPHQKWAFHGNKITKQNLAPDCIDISKNDPSDNAPIIAYPHHGGLNQMWHIENIMPA